MRPREVIARRGELVILDVREPEEWRAGHIDGALHIPLMELPYRTAELNGSRIVAVCRSGSRSGEATRFLRLRGLDVENLDGGLLAWHREGLPLTSSDGTPGRVA